ncbi:MAG: type II toxin-antitoxin system PemK/MazF family toxin [Chlorobi bacterium]|nr:type II toxin-antitoxin system PemK/MazF family toxin [Chlorobiota bacterium]
MSVYQREIVEVNFQLPDRTFEPHPIVVISNNNVFDVEDIFYGLMISTKIFNPDFEFEITDEMVSKPFPMKSYVKCQLIQSYQENEILNRFGSMGKEHFDKLMEKLFQSVFQ